MGGPAEVSTGSYKRVLSLLFQVTRRVNEGATLVDLLRLVASHAGELVGADSCSIMLLDEQRRELFGKVSAGLTPEEEALLSFRVGEGVAGWVVEHGAPARVEDTTRDERFKVLPGQALHIRSILCVPLITQDGAIGTLTVTSGQVGAFTPEHEELLVYLGGAVVRDVENARLYRLAITDPLTHAFNRQYLFQRLPAELERSRRYGEPLSVALMDIDHFKHVNDTHGHLAGDFVLKELVRLALTQVREVDALVRHGGEEFLLLLPNTPRDAAATVAERLRASVEKLVMPWSNLKLRVTASFGVAEWHREETDEDLLRRADEALYRAKDAGRNRVDVA
jgi:diguanylate cyclase (GGDEF)-like protein